MTADDIDRLAVRIAAHLSTEIHWADDEIAPQRCQVCWFITELKAARAESQYHFSLYKDEIFQRDRFKARIAELEAEK